MRKRLVGVQGLPTHPTDEGWLDLEHLAEVELTSEDPDQPIDWALLPGTGSGWRAGGPGKQVVRLLFDAPQRIQRIQLHFVAADSTRTQEIVLRWSGDKGRSFQEIVRQQWNFSPHGATSETEDYHVDLASVSALELEIVPDIGGGAARASLDSLRLA